MALAKLENGNLVMIMSGPGVEYIHLSLETSIKSTKAAQLEQEEEVLLMQ